MAPDDRRAQLLVAARTVFASLGYHRANVSAIIDQAGVARGTFYNYFESKRVCFQAVLSEMMDSVASAVLPIDVAGDIPKQVELNLERLFAALTEDDELPRVLFAEAAGIDEADKVGVDFDKNVFVFLISWLDFVFETKIKKIFVEKLTYPNIFWSVLLPKKGSQIFVLLCV